MKHASRQQVSAPERTKTGVGEQESNGEPTTQPMQQLDNPPNEEENDSSQDDVDQVEELDLPNEDDENDQLEEPLRRYEPIINAGHRLHPRQAVYNFKINDNFSFHQLIDELRKIYRQQR
jgi:hypothetical protein